MRKHLLATLAISSVVALVVAAAACAKLDKFQVGNLILEADGGVTPKALQRASSPR